MEPLTVETEVLSEGLVQVRVPDAPAGRRVRVTVEEVAVSDPARIELDASLERLREDHRAGRITQPEFSEAYVEALERYDRERTEGPSKRRELGRLKGMIEILPGFDDPIPGLEWAYGGLPS